jgi:hypothetical protein
VTETRLPACAEEACRGERPAVSLGAYESGSLDVTRFEVRGSELCGVQVASGAALDLRDGLVHQADIGACVQVEAYDAERLTERVVYTDNRINSVFTSVPVPGEVVVPERVD